MNPQNSHRYSRGDIYYVDFGNNTGSVICGVHPAMVIQNSMGNRYSPTVVVAAIVTDTSRKRQVTHVVLEGRFGLHHKSVLLLEHLATVDKTMLYQYLGHANEDLLHAVDYALIASLGLQPLMKVYKKRKQTPKLPS